MKIRTLAALLLCATSLTGCLKGILPDPDGDAKRVEDEAAATGAACRQAGRSLEQCFTRNDGLNRNGALRGWRDMDDYMRQNKIDPQPPTQQEVDKELGLKDASKPDSDAKGVEPKPDEPKAADPKPGAAPAPTAK